MKSFIAALALAAMPFSANAAALGSCENLDSISNLVGNVQRFAEGAIKVAYISTEEPAAASAHLLIYTLVEPMGYDCVSVDLNKEGTGFYSIDFDQLKSSYDTKDGLVLKVPVNVPNHETGMAKKAGKVKIQIKAGKVSLK